MTTAPTGSDAERAQETGPRGVERLARRHPAAVVLLGFVLLSILLFSPAWLAPNTSQIGLLDGDPTYFRWALFWPPYALTHGHSPLFTDYLNYPDGANLMWSMQPLPGLVMWPVTAAFGTVVSYNLLCTLALPLSGWCMVLAMRRIVPTWTGAVAAGLFYGFGPFLIPQALDHGVLTLAFGPPLLMLLLHEALVRQRWAWWRTAVALGVLLTAQLTTFVETVATMAVAATVAIVVLATVRWPDVRSHAPHAVRAIGGGAVVFLITAAWPLYSMLLGAQHLNGGAVKPPDRYVSDLVNLVVPAPTHLFSRVLSGPGPSGWTGGNPAEYDAYLGIPLIVILAALILYRWSLPAVRVLGLTGIGILILTLGPSLHVNGAVTWIPLPARLASGLPLLDNILWSRMAIFVDLLAGALLGIFVSLAVERTHWWSPRVVGFGLLLVVLSLVPEVPLAVSTIPPTPRFFAGGAVQRIPDGSVVLVAPFTINGDNDIPEQWQIDAGLRFRLPSGYVFVPTPQGTAYHLNSPLAFQMLMITEGRPAPSLTPQLRRDIVAEFNRIGPSVVVMGPMANMEEMDVFLTALLGRSSEQIDGVAVWWHPATSGSFVR